MEEGAWRRGCVGPSLPFSFSQGRPVLQYFDKKVACLRIAEVLDEDMQCAEIKEGLRDPEYRSAIRLAAANNTIAWLRQELTVLESDCRAATLHMCLTDTVSWTENKTRFSSTSLRR